MNKKTEQELLKIVDKNYEEIAGEFHQTRKKLFWPELAELVSGIKDGDRILDVGCGNGRLLELFKDKKVEYLGIDSCKPLVEIAKSYELRVTSYEFKEGDILDLGKIPELEFDYVFCIAVLHHIPGENLQIEALRQLKNKIKDDGKIILSVWSLWDQWKYFKLIVKFWLLKILKKNQMDLGDILFGWKGQGSQRYYHAFRRSELKRLVKKSGLRLEKLIKADKNYYLALSK